MNLNNRSWLKKKVLTKRKNICIINVNKFGATISCCTVKVMLREIVRIRLRIQCMLLRKRGWLTLAQRKASVVDSTAEAFLYPKNKPCRQKKNIMPNICNADITFEYRQDLWYRQELCAKIFADSDRVKSGGNRGIVQSRLQILHIHVNFVAPPDTRHMVQPGTDQHQSGVPI